MAQFTQPQAVTHLPTGLLRLATLAPLLALAGCCTSQEDLPADEVCKDIGFSIANRTEACTGDRDLASRRWDLYEAQYSCRVTTVDDRIRQHYVCPSEIMKMSCEQFVAYVDDFDALFRGIPECLFVVGRSDGTPIFTPDGGTMDSGTDAADAADDVVVHDAPPDAPLDVVDSTADAPADVSDAGTDSSDADAAQPDSALDASDASVDVAADVIITDAPIDTGSDAGDSAPDVADFDSGIGVLPRIDSYTQGTAPLSNQVYVAMNGQSFDVTSQMMLAGNALTLGASNLPTQLIGQGTVSTPPHGYYKLQVINGPAASGARSNIVYYTVTPASGSPELVDYSQLSAQPGDTLQLIGRNFPATPTFVVADSAGVEAVASVQGTLSWRGQTLTAANVVVPSNWQSGQLAIRDGGDFRGPMLWVQQSLTSMPGATVTATSNWPGFPAGAVVDNDLTTAWVEEDFCGVGCTNGPMVSITLGAASPVKQLMIAAIRSTAAYNSVREIRTVLEDSSGNTLLDEAFRMPADRYDLYLEFAQALADVRVIRVQILNDEHVKSGFSEVAAYAN